MKKIVSVIFFSLAFFMVKAKAAPPPVCKEAKASQQTVTFLTQQFTVMDQQAAVIETTAPNVMVVNVTHASPTSYGAVQTQLKSGGTADCDIVDAYGSVTSQDGSATSNKAAQKHLPSFRQIE